MNLYAINTGFFKPDGGAMFGVVPKSGPLNPARGTFEPFVECFFNIFLLFSL